MDKNMAVILGKDKVRGKKKLIDGTQIKRNGTENEKIDEKVGSHVWKR